MTGLILDLRYNPGGLLQAATEVSDKFLDGGTIVSTRADRETPNQPTEAAPILARAVALNPDDPRARANLAEAAMRMRVLDRTGVLADITRLLADSEISIDAMVQKEPHAGEDAVDIIMLTHQTVEKRVNAALAKIEALPVVTGKVTRIRLEHLDGPR